MLEQKWRICHQNFKLVINAFHCHYPSPISMLALENFQLCNVSILKFLVTTFPIWWNQFFSKKRNHFGWTKRSFSNIPVRYIRPSTAGVKRLVGSLVTCNIVTLHFLPLIWVWVTEVVTVKLLSNPTRWRAETPSSFRNRFKNTFGSSLAELLDELIYPIKSDEKLCLKNIYL